MTQTPEQFAMRDWRSDPCDDGDERELRTCASYAKVPGKPQCCASCHDDAESGFNELIELYLDPMDSDRVTHRLCCEVSKWLPPTSHPEGKS